MGKVVSLAKV